MTKIKLSFDEQLLLYFALQPFQPSVNSCIKRLMSYPFLPDLTLKSEGYYRNFLKTFSKENAFLWDKIRYINTEELNIRVRRIIRSAIIYNGLTYVDEMLYEHEGEFVEIKVDNSHGNGINVFTRKGVFICTAYPVKYKKVGTLKPLKKNTSKFFQDKPGEKK